MPHEAALTDLFGKPIADGTKSEANIASHFPYNPERWRLYSGSATEANRIFLRYNPNEGSYDQQRLNGNGEWDVHTLKPDAGETLIMETAERFNYVVGYEAYITHALSISQALKSGDRLRCGPYDGSDGYGVEFRPELGEEKAEMFIMRDGDKVQEQPVNIRAIRELEMSQDEAEEFALQVLNHARDHK